MPATVSSLTNLSRKLVRSFAALLLVLFGLLGFALWNFHRLGQADGWKAHTYQVLLESQRAKETLFQMDGGVRAYVISGNAGDLRSFEQGKRNFKGHIFELQQLVEDNPLQASQLSQVVQEEKAWQTNLLEPTIALRQPSDSLEQAARKLSGNVLPRRRALEGIRSSLDVFENAEKSLLQSRVATQEYWRHLTEQTLWLGSGFSIGLVLFLSSTAVRAVNESRAAYGRLRQSNEQLTRTQAGLELEVEQRRAAQERLKRAVTELKRSNAELEQFAYVASHDLQEPLRAVAGCVQVLKRRYEGKLDERADQFIGHAVEGAQRMQNLIQDLLAYSRVGTKGKPFVLLALDKVLDGALERLSVSVDESKAHIERDPLPELWGDAGQLESVFQNLLSNAIKFRGEAPPRVSISCREQAGDDENPEGENSEAGWTFSIIDEGSGIEPQYFERIFVMFQRLHTRIAYPGTGIGLAIVKKIIERHGGRIWVESTPGRGSTFSFWLPLHPPDMGEPQDAIELEPEGEPQPKFAARELVK